MKRFVFVVFLLAILGSAGAGIWLIHFEPYAGFEDPVFVELPRGTTTLAIGDRLASNGVIQHSLLFAAARALHPNLKPQAGEYQFVKAATPYEVLRRMAQGDVYRVDLTVPEGSNVFDIAQLVERSGLGQAADFLKEALPQEGYLFPATYRFDHKTGVKEICRSMRRQFDKVWKQMASGAPQRDTVILASLVEREAVVEGDRKRIAAVFRNRLAKGMKLDCDPTVVYAALLESRWRGTIYRSDLLNPHPYNTYQHTGLPPGPIANPGRASLEAALHPAETADLYFVAMPDGSGAHVFSQTLEAHERAVKAYRHGQQEAAGQAVAPSPKRGTR